MGGDVAITHSASAVFVVMLGSPTGHQLPLGGSVNKISCNHLRKEIRLLSKNRLLTPSGKIKKESASQIQNGYPAEKKIQRF